MSLSVRMTCHPMSWYQQGADRRFAAIAQSTTCEGVSVKFSDVLTSHNTDTAHQGVKPRCRVSLQPPGAACPHWARAGSSSRLLPLGRAPGAPPRAARSGAEARFPGLQGPRACGGSGLPHCVPQKFSCCGRMSCCAAGHRRCYATRSGFCAVRFRGL